jgi:hypothetical protein
VLAWSVLQAKALHNKEAVHVCADIGLSCICVLTLCAALHVCAGMGFVLQAEALNTKEAVHVC